MRILMLGNSLTFANDMPHMLAALTGAEVVHHTRGGARLLSDRTSPHLHRHRGQRLSDSGGGGFSGEFVRGRQTGRRRRVYAG